MQDEYRRIIENIKRIIDEKGMKHCAVAERAGLSKQEFSHLVNERKLLRVEHILPIATALGVEPNDLYGVRSRH